MTAAAFLDAGLLERYFGELSFAFTRSTSGAVIERQSMHHPLAIMRARREHAQKHGGNVERYYRPARGLTTVEITGDECTQGGYTPSDRDLRDYARASRRFRSIEQASPVVAGRVVSIELIAECYFGDLGAQHARSPRPGRIGALYHLTAAGQSLLAVEAKAVAGKGAALAPAEAMLNAIAAHGSRSLLPDARGRGRLAYSSAPRDLREQRRQFLLRAERQAIALLGIAALRWNGAVREEKAEREGRRVCA